MFGIGRKKKPLADDSIADEIVALLTLLEGRDEGMLESFLTSQPEAASRLSAIRAWAKAHESPTARRARRRVSAEVWLLYADYARRQMKDLWTSMNSFKLPLDKRPVWARALARAMGLDEFAVVAGGAAPSLDDFASPACVSNDAGGAKTAAAQAREQAVKLAQDILHGRQEVTPASFAMIVLEAMGEPVTEPPIGSA